MSGLGRLIGIPWAEGGRDETGCDCWGLLCMAFARLHDIELPAYDGRPVAGPPLARLVVAEQESWLQVAPGLERPGDVVCFRGLPPHVGLVIGRGRMLHVARGQRSCWSGYHSPEWAPRLQGFYRHPLLAETRA